MWLINDSADPLNGWPIHEVLETAKPARNDLYGTLYFDLRDIFGRFCDKLSRLKTISFHLIQVNVLQLPATLK